MSAMAANAKVKRATRRRVMVFLRLSFRPRLVARMEGSVIRDRLLPDCATLHPGYGPIRKQRPQLSFQPLGGVLDDAEVGKLADVETRLDETEIAGEIDIALQCRAIGHHVRVAIVVLSGENPIGPLCRLL